MAVRTQTLKVTIVYDRPSRPDSESPLLHNLIDRSDLNGGRRNALERAVTGREIEHWRTLSTRTTAATVGVATKGAQRPIRRCCG